MTKHLEVRLLLKNRERDYCYCEVHSSGKWDRPVSAKDKKLLGSFGIIRDITHRKQIEEELKRAYKELKSRQIQLIQAEKMAGIGQLAASTAHEINNPLSGIIGNLRILKEDYLDKCLDMISQLDIDKFREFKEDFEKNFPTHIEDSLRCAEHIKDVVTQLLAFSRPEEGRPMEEVDINSEIDKSLTFVSHELKSKCEVIKDFQPLPKVLAHPRQLDQVFINILTNASQAIDDKGHISIKTYLKAPYIFIEFTDDGKGIPKEQLSKIFEPFFTTKEVGKGTGLGLAITYEIIKNHNGRIDVRSEIGKGTTFTIKLPVKNTSFLLA
jgi:signal transduction histidine kinase